MSKNSLHKDKIKFLFLEGLHTSAANTLAAAGYTNVVSFPKALSADDLKAEIADAHFVGLRSRTQLTEEVFDAARKLVAVGCFCIGTNQVDLNSAGMRGIPVFNAPYSNTRSVAELVIAEAILLLRGIPAKNAAAHRGEWLKTAARSYEIRGKTLGIVGYGNIGMQLGVMAESLGMTVEFYDVVTKLPVGNARQVTSLDDLLGRADVVSLHVPQLASTANMLGTHEIAVMKPSSILINASRGNVVDIESLEAALHSGHIAGAAIDVFPIEPRSNDDEFLSPLRGIDNAILTPHIGGSTMEAQENIGIEVAEKLARYSDTGATLSAVNFPEVALPEHEGQHRLLHVHRNVPGVMGAINRVFSDNGINICGQYLQTRNDIGYVVIDVASEYSDMALTQLRSIEGTLRCRVLF